MKVRSSGEVAGSAINSPGRGAGAAAHDGEAYRMGGVLCSSHGVFVDEAPVGRGLCARRGDPREGEADGHMAVGAARDPLRGRGAGGNPREGAEPGAKRDRGTQATARRRMRFAGRGASGETRREGVGAAGRGAGAPHVSGAEPAEWPGGEPRRGTCPKQAA